MVSGPQLSEIVPETRCAVWWSGDMVMVITLLHQCASVYIRVAGNQLYKMTAYVVLSCYPMCKATMN